MKQIALSFFFLIFLTAFSQENYNSETYRVTLGDIETNTFKKDSTANALVIYEQGNSYVDKNKYNLRTEVKHKIKILNKEGFDNANVTIYLYKSKDKKTKVEDIIATTYNKINGEVVKSNLTANNIFREEYNENYTLVKFTLPNVKEGSVITYSYKLIKPQNFMFNYKGWDFQAEIPKLYSEYKTSIPANWLYHIKLVGEQKLAINDYEIKKGCLQMYSGASADCGNSIYAMKNIPAFIEEDYMTTKSNYLARVEYELETFRGMDGIIKHYTKTWKDVDKEFKTDKEFGKQLKKSIDTETLLSPDIINETDNLKKAQAIYQYVQNTYTWNGDYKIFRDVSVKNLLKNKSGNVSSINILLHNLLKESHINVKPILVSTRNNGFPTKLFPVISDFNYVIVQATINEKTYLLDATDGYLNFGDIPFKCLNLYGRLLDFKNGSEWIDLKPSNPSNIFYKVDLQIDENNTITGAVKSKRTGFHALNSKKKYHESEDEYLEELENRYPYLDISDFEIASKDIASSDFEESYKLEYNYDGTGNNIYLNPFFVTFFKENPFKLEERTYPIDFGYKSSYFYIFKIELDNDYEVIDMPKAQNISLPNNTGQILFSTHQIGKTLNLTLKIDFKKPIYEVEYYPYLKAFMNKIVDIQTNSIILLKKNN